MSGTFILLLLLTATSVIATAGVAVLVNRERKVEQELGCGRCGYPVRGLNGLTCPECGADLRAVGIVRQRADSPARLVLGVVLVFCVGGWVSLAIVKALWLAGF